MADNRSLDLVSWRPGPTRAALENFIAESVAAVAPTLWCEKPMYAQLDFLIHELTPSAHHRKGPAKVTQLQMALDRRPRFAAGNTSGDAEMLEFSMSHDGPTMAMLIDHDDAEREYAYEGTAATFESSEPSTDTATRLGRTTVSMRRDWDRIFPAQ